MLVKPSRARDVKNVTDFAAFNIVRVVDFWLIVTIEEWR
jgi:hypothetical protein